MSLREHLDFKEQLQEAAEKLGIEEEVSAENLDEEIITEIESTNAELSKSTKGFKESNRYIFRQKITYENAEKLKETMDKLKDVSDINYLHHKKILHEVLIKIIMEDQSPIEMLIYLTKEYPNNKEFKNLVLDELKEIYVFDNKLKSSYKNILRHWSFNDQIKIVIESIHQMRLDGFSEELLTIFETNNTLREDAALTIIALGYENYYDNIINLLTVNKEETKESSLVMYEILKNMFKTSEEAVDKVFKIYMESSITKVAANTILGLIKKNTTSQMLNELDKYAHCSNKRLQDRAIFLLGKINNNKARQILDTLKYEDDINKKALNISLGFTNNKNNVEYFKKIIEDESKDEEERTSALISLANIGDKSHIEYIKGFLNVSNKFRIASSSALVQLGESNMLKNIFEYILGESEELVREATTQINRLKGLKNDQINEALFKVFKFILDKDNENLTLRILDIIKSSRIDEDMVKIILEKFINTESERVKMKMLSYIGENFIVLNSNLKNQVKNSLVKGSKSDSMKIKEYSTKILKLVSKNEELVPTINECC